MKLLHISDTHSFHRQFPVSRFKNIDIIIHSGDESNYRDPYRNEVECRDFIDWYKDVPIKHKIFIAGNHSTSIERRMVTPANFHDAGIIYLEHEEITIDGLKIFGSPYTPTFGEWSFMKARDKINRMWEHIPTDTDILVTHGPAKGVRDLTEDYGGELKQCGDSSLMKWIFKHPPKAHLFGHIHNMDGIYNQGISRYSKLPTIFSNGSCVDDGKFDLGLTSFGNIIEL